MQSHAIFIIGPARSGTKLFRDTLATHADIAKVPYDINYLWKLHSPDTTHDELSTKDANDRIKSYMGRYLSKKRKNKKYIVEKTVSNTLRVGFVDSVIPNSKFIYLYRDGRDSVESVIRQWGKFPELRYLLGKLLGTPLHLVLPYLLQYGRNLLAHKTSKSVSDQYVWGVKFRDYKKALKTQSTNEFCCTQWNECVDAMLEQQYLLGNRCHIVHYEDFIQNTEKVLNEVALFLDVPSDFTIPTIHIDKVGFSKSNVDHNLYKLLSNNLKENLAKLGYQ